MSPLRPFMSASRPNKSNPLRACWLLCRNGASIWWPEKGCLWAWAATFRRCEDTASCHFHKAYIQTHQCSGSMCCRILGQASWFTISNIIRVSRHLVIRDKQAIGSGWNREAWKSSGYSHHSQESWCQQISSYQAGWGYRARCNEQGSGGGHPGENSGRYFWNIRKSNDTPEATSSCRLRETYLDSY